MWKLRKFWHSGQHLAGARRGSILIETALLLPILLLLLAGAIETARLMLAQQKVSNLSSQTADMMAQAEFGLSESEIIDIFAAIAHISDPFDLVANGRVVVSGVIGTNGGSTANEIAWQRCAGDLSTVSSELGNEGASNVDIPGEIELATNEMAIVAEVSMTYEPFIFAGFFDPMTLGSDATFRPRFGALSTISADAPPASC